MCSTANGNQPASTTRIGGGGTGGSSGYNCPRCAVPLTKFWQQDSPLWGCIDCREIYTGSGKTAIGRLPRSWTATSVMAGALLGSAATTEKTETIGSGSGFSPIDIPPPDTFKKELDWCVLVLLPPPLSTFTPSRHQTRIPSRGAQPPFLLLVLLCRSSRNSCVLVSLAALLSKCSATWWDRTIPSACCRLQCTITTNDSRYYPAEASRNLSATPG